MRLQLSSLTGLQCHLKAQLEEDALPSSLMWLLAGFSSSQAVEFGASVPHSLLPRDLSQFFATWATPECALLLGMLLPSE